MKDLQLIRPQRLCSLLDISMATLYRWHKNGKLPIKKIKIGPGVVGFRKTDVEQWLDDQTESKSDEKIAT